MRYMADVYSTSFRVYASVIVQYRVALSFWTLQIIIEPLIYMAVWSVVTKQNGAVEGFTAGAFSAYYITWILVRHVVLAFSAFVVQQRIQSGDLSKFLVRPLHPIHVDIGYNIAYQVVSFPILLCAIVLMALFIPPEFHLSWSSLLIIPACLLAYPLRFFTSWMIGVLCFWIVDARALFQIYFTGEILLGGNIAPLVIFPDQILVLASVLPFRWMLSFPVEVFLGFLSPEDILIGFGMQVLWLTIVVILLNVLWKQGVKRYSAVGA